jgi:hypothetical protein
LDDAYPPICSYDPHPGGAIGMDDAILVVRILFSGVSVVAAISKMVDERADSRKMLSEFDVPELLTVALGIVLPNRSTCYGLDANVSVIKDELRFPR